VDESWRVAQAQRLADRQRRNAARALKQMERERAKSPLPSIEGDDLVTRIQVANKNFKATPLSGHKVWIHICSWLGALFVLAAASEDILGAVILSPFVLIGLWVIINLPSWVSNGIGSSSRNSGGKYV